MFFRKIYIVLISVASAADSQSAPKPAAVVHNVAPRQTDNLLALLVDLSDAFNVTVCLPQALPLVSDLPKVPKGLLTGDFVSQALSQTTLPLSGVCDFSITGPVGSTYSSFLPTLYSWYDAHSATLARIASSCSNATPLIQTVQAYGNCRQIRTASGDGTLSIQTNTMITTPATTTTSGSTAATSSVSQGLAPGEASGIVFSALAAAGLLGAVVACDGGSVQQS